MNKNYFLKLLNIYCKEVHKNEFCLECKRIKDAFENGVLDINVYYKIIAYSSCIYKRFHLSTFNKESIL